MGVPRADGTRAQGGSRHLLRPLERGAAAVEFALITVIMVPLMFGILDYGLWFNDSLNARQGVREAARQAVVKNISCTTGTTDMAKIVCMTKAQVGAVTGPSYAMVKAPQGWSKGKPLLVCVIVKTRGVTGITPLPSNNLISSKTQMSIEVDTTVPTGATASASSEAKDTLPSGTGDWSFCS